jgi:hypothetical protein
LAKTETRKKVVLGPSQLADAASNRTIQQSSGVKTNKRTIKLTSISSESGIDISNSSYKLNSNLKENESHTNPTTISSRSSRQPISKLPKKQAPLSSASSFEDLLSNLANITGLTSDLSFKARSVFAPCLCQTKPSPRRVKVLMPNGPIAETGPNNIAVPYSETLPSEKDLCKLECGIPSDQIAAFYGMALRLLNQTSKTVSDIISSPPDSTKNGEETAAVNSDIQGSSRIKNTQRENTVKHPRASQTSTKEEMLSCVTEIAEICMQTVQYTEQYMPRAGYDAEKAASNLVTRLLEAGDVGTSQ